MLAQQYRQRGLPLIIVCPHGVVGPNDHSVWGYYQRLYLNRLMPPMGWSPDSIFSLVEVNDLARGIVLAAEKARLGETYILAGEPRSLREHLAFWQGRPGAFKTAMWMPAGLMSAMFWPMEPLQRPLGLPAFMSREGVIAATTNLNYSSAKAQQELGWTHKSAQEMWLSTLDGEMELMRLRQKRDLVSRLNPLDIEG